MTDRLIDLWPGVAAGIIESCQPWTGVQVQMDLAWWDAIGPQGMYQYSRGYGAEPLPGRPGSAGFAARWLCRVEDVLSAYEIYHSNASVVPHDMDHDVVVRHLARWGRRPSWCRGYIMEACPRRILRPLGSAAISTLSPTTKNHRIDLLGLGDVDGVESAVAVEVKRTRADLRGDLKVGKMIRYEPWATHCMLVLGSELYDTGFDDLRKMGLPDHWGVMRMQQTIMDNGTLGIRFQQRRGMGELRHAAAIRGAVCEQYNRYAGR